VGALQHDGDVVIGTTMRVNQVKEVILATNRDGQRMVCVVTMTRRHVEGADNYPPRHGQ
jgi:hypothetical protein